MILYFKEVDAPAKKDLGFWSPRRRANQIFSSWSGEAQSSSENEYSEDNAIELEIVDFGLFDYK